MMTQLKSTALRCLASGMLAFTPALALAQTAADPAETTAPAPHAHHARSHTHHASTHTAAHHPARHHHASHAHHRASHHHAAPTKS